MFYVKLKFVGQFTLRRMAEDELPQQTKMMTNNSYMLVEMLAEIKHFREF